MNIQKNSIFTGQGMLFYLSGLLALSVFAGCAGGGSQSSGGAGGFRQDCLSGSITVWGEAPIFASKATARDKAKKDACRTAIQKCIGEQVSSRTEVADGQSVTSEIYSQAQGLCKKQEIVEEQEYNLDTIKMLKVFARFEVSKAAVNEQINTMQKMVGNPRVMVLIREELNLKDEGKSVKGFTSRNGVAAGSLRDVLISRGYTIVDPAKAAPQGLDEAAIAEDPTKLPKDVLDRAAKAGADVLIVGNVTANAQNISNPVMKDFKSYAATGSISILTIWGDGKVVGQFNKHDNGANITHRKAAESAVRRFAVGGAKNPNKKLGAVAKFVHSRLSDQWAKITRSNVIKFRVKGLGQKDLGTLRDDLIERTAVKKVDEVSLDGDMAVWEVTYPGRAFALADTISFYGGDPRMFFVVRDTSKSMKVTAVKRGELAVSFE